MMVTHFREEEEVIRIKGMAVQFDKYIMTGNGQKIISSG
jgi:hypothetical protein